MAEIALLFLAAGAYSILMVLFMRWLWRVAGLLVRRA